jgi:hypothetical protein
MTDTRTPLRKQISRCYPDRLIPESERGNYCRLISDQWQPPAGTPYYWFPSGITMNFGFGDVPLHSDYVLCPKHKSLMDKELENGTI